MPLWKKEITSNDHFLTGGREDDLIIPSDSMPSRIMGETGVGKSTFINTLLGESRATVGHSLESETSYLDHYQLRRPGRRVFLVDTPGFDDTREGDREILRRIAVWLANSYSDKVKIAGLIYLHDVTRPRISGTQRRNKDMFEKLCGPQAGSSIILATSKWSGNIPDEVTHERFLRDVHWKDMIRDGSKMRRFDGTQASAQGIVNEILAWKALDATQIQAELVDIDRLLSETEAGRTLRYTLKELLQKQKEEVDALRREGKEANAEIIIENDNKIRVLLEQIDQLKIPLMRKLGRFLGLLKS
ncbi:hypothetical protein H0H93_009467 [Arthromyces matolae]|nr:hypothetical protein H0H93_009467 [Arthromyces matolae]